MNKIHEWVNTAGILLIAILVLVGGNQSVPAGASGSRFPNGISANSTSPNAGEVVATTLTVTATSTGASLGSTYYETKGGIDYAYMQQSFTATSSHIVSFQTPFYGATSTIESLSCESTNVGIAEANNLYIATTSAASRYATTSTTALNSAFAMGTGEWRYDFTKNVATSSSDTLYAGVNVLEGKNVDSSSNYILGPTDNTNVIIATSTPGTFVTYDEGTCYETVIRH